MATFSSFENNLQTGPAVLAESAGIPNARELEQKCLKINQ